MANLRDDGYVLAKIESAEHPKTHPERGAERIEHKKPLPLHSQDAGHDAVELAEDVDEAREGNGHCTVSREDSRDLIEAGRSKSDPGTITRYGSATEASADPISDIVAHHRSGPCSDQKTRQRSFGAPRKERREDQQRLSRHRPAHRLDRQDDRHSHHAVGTDKMLQTANKLPYLFHADLRLVRSDRWRPTVRLVRSRSQ